MFTTRRGFATALALPACLAIGVCLCGPASDGKPTGGGGKPPPSRPIVYFSVNSARTAWAIRLTDEGGSSDIAVKQGGNLRSGGRPRWSPDGLLIGGHYGQVGDDLGIMVMQPDGTNEQVIVSGSEFNAWNLSRPGVQYSLFLNSENENCWLGANAIVFPGYTNYDASLYGGDPGDTVSGRSLFIADATGTITPLTETENFGGSSFSHTDPHWTPALDKVVFVGTRNVSLHVGASNELYAINPDGTGLQQITDFGDTVQLYAPVWSPAGDRIAVTVRTPGEGRRDLWILDVDLNQPNPGTGAGGRITFLDPFKVDASAAGYPLWTAWAPDGQRLVFSRTAVDNRNRISDELVITDVASGAETVVRRTNLIELPDWKPVP